MSFPKTSLLLLLSCLPLLARADSGAERLAAHIVEVSDSLVKARLGRLDASMMEHRHDRIVQRRIVNYIEKWPKATGRMVARAARYFPIFEEQLARAGMPLELKYMAIQESALRPYATSWVGAGGLWQLMPGTARELGLTVTRTLDERLDAELGCAAGLRYLSYQYERYGDWALAMAAYNCGPGNVNKAIRRSGRKNPNYWQIRKHLPGETADYLPSIIAAVYIMTYFSDHGILAGDMPLDMQITEAVTVDRFLSMHRVAQVTNLPAERVIELNPQYLHGYIPGDGRPHRLRLPARTVPAMRTYLQQTDPAADEASTHLPWASPRLHAADVDTDPNYTQYRTFATHRDSTLRQVARAQGVPVDQLSVWSATGVLDSLASDQMLVFYRVNSYRPYDPRVRGTPDAAPVIAAYPPAPVDLPAPILKPAKVTVATQNAETKPGILARLKNWMQ